MIVWLIDLWVCHVRAYPVFVPLHFTSHIYTRPGRDTTACALSWQHLELLRHPGVYKEVVREAAAIGGEGALQQMTQEERCDVCHLSGS